MTKIDELGMNRCSYDDHDDECLVPSGDILRNGYDDNTLDR